jgi:phytanoyl-CoA hydroxylase
MLFEAQPTATPVPWEGAMPGGAAAAVDAAGGAAQEAAVRAAGFVELEVKAGDLVVIHGQIDHLSLANTSQASRHTFQLHLIEGPTEGVTWSPDNWLQYPEGVSFPTLGGGAD